MGPYNTVDVHTSPEPMVFCPGTFSTIVILFATGYRSKSQNDQDPREKIRKSWVLYPGVILNEFQILDKTNMEIQEHILNQVLDLREEILES